MSVPADLEWMPEEALRMLEEIAALEPGLSADACERLQLHVIHERVRRLAERMEAARSRLAVEECHETARQATAIYAELKERG